MGAAEYRNESSTDADGLVQAEVGMDGLPTRLTISPIAMKLPAHDLAEHVVTAIRAAHARRVRQMLQHFDKVVGPDARPVEDVDAAMQTAHDQVIRASRVATEQADAIRRKLGDILDR